MSVGFYSEGFSVVLIDDIDVVCIVIEYLIEFGYIDIVFVGGLIGVVELSFGDV